MPVGELNGIHYSNFSLLSVSLGCYVHRSRSTARVEFREVAVGLVVERRIVIIEMISHASDKADNF